MKQFHSFLFLTSFLATTAYSAILVTPTGVTLTQGETYTVSDPTHYRVVHLIDNSGFGATAPTAEDYLTRTHTAPNTEYRSWVTIDPSPSGGDYFIENSGNNPDPVLMFDLGATYELMRFVYWGYFHSVNEAKDFTLEFSTTGTDGSFSGAQHFSQTTVRANNVGYFDLTHPVEANAVRITITGNFNGDRVGLGEVKFLAVPEPSAALFGGLGMLALLRRRHR